MYFFLFSFCYLTLRDSRGLLVIWRDILPVVALSGALSCPFILLDKTNFFGTNGMIDKVGNLTACLTGFYVAGLLAVATFSSAQSALDTPVKIGKVFQNKEAISRRQALTRREYVCSIFGYLAFLSLIISILAALSSGLSESLADSLKEHLVRWTDQNTIFDIVAISAKICSMIVLSHLVVTSGYGLYYLVYKLYSKDPKLKQPPPSGPRIS